VAGISAGSLFTVSGTAGCFSGAGGAGDPNAAAGAAATAEGGLIVLLLVAARRFALMKTILPCSSA